MSVDEGYPNADYAAPGITRKAAEAVATELMDYIKHPVWVGNKDPEATPTWEPRVVDENATLDTTVPDDEMVVWAARELQDILQINADTIKELAT